MDQAVSNSREPGTLCFQCNICGTNSLAQLHRLRREDVSCSTCGSTPRARAVIRVLSLGLFGKNLALTDFSTRRAIRGLGMTDWEGYANRLSGKFSYRNTYYHREPRLDISATEIAADFMANDFIISSEVFEHVAPPVNRAFENVSKMLNPGGLFILTVPYGSNKETIEYFPDLYDFTIERRDETVALKNKTKEGTLQEFKNVVLHEGAGLTLEMRVFSEDDLVQYLKDAGFHAIKVHSEPDFVHGIWWPYRYAFPISARKRPA